MASGGTVTIDSVESAGADRAAVDLDDAETGDAGLDSIGAGSIDVDPVQ
jgi:hypothetical protein